MTFGFLAVIGAGAGVALLFGIRTLATVLTYVGIAYFVSLALEPLIRIGSRVGISRRWSVAILFSAAACALAGTIAIVEPIVSRQINEAVRILPEAVDNLLKQEWVDDALNQVGLRSSVTDILNSLTGFITEPQRLSTIGGGLLQVGTGIVDGVVGTVIVLVLTAYFAATLPSMTDRAFLFVPASKAGRARALYEQMASSVGRYVIGQVGLALITAALTFLMLLIVGVRAALLLALLAFVGALVPIVGTVIAGIIMIIVCFFTSPTAGVVAAIFYVVYHPVEGYLLGPKIMGRVAHVSGAVALISVTAGAALGGVLGAIVAIPVAAAATIFADAVIIPAQRLR